MTKEQIIKLGMSLGLFFDEKTNYKDALANGRVVFDGCNGQRFLFESKWPKNKIYKQMGISLIQMGKRQKALEIHNVLSINSD